MQSIHEGECSCNLQDGGNRDAARDPLDYVGGYAKDRGKYRFETMIRFGQ